MTPRKPGRSHWLVSTVALPFALVAMVGLVFWVVGLTVMAATREWVELWTEQA